MKTISCPECDSDLLQWKRDTKINVDGMNKALEEGTKFECWYETPTNLIAHCQSCRHTFIITDDNIDTSTMYEQGHILKV